MKTLALIGWLCALVASVACESAAARGAAAKKALSDPRPDVRAAAAAVLQKMETEDPEAIGDHGEAHWKRRLATIPSGATGSAMNDVLASPPGSFRTEGPGAVGFRLDDYWAVVAGVDRDGRLTKMGPLLRLPLVVDSPPWPKDYSGTWSTYRISGALFSVNDVQSGRSGRYRVSHENGQLWSDEHYVDGKLEGETFSFHANGKRAYERHYVAGTQVGRSIEWHENGKIWIEATYVNGKLDGPKLYRRNDGTRETLFVYRAGEETGQASWDEQGKLLYARGSAEQVARDLK